MAILTVNESAELLKSAANGVMADGSVSMYPLHARAILDVLAAFEDVQVILANVQARLNAVTAERNQLQAYYTRIELAHAIYADEAREVGAPNMSLDDWLVYFMARDIDDIQKWNDIPWQALRSVFQAADADGYYNDDVAEWLMENGVTP